MTKILMFYQVKKYERSFVCTERSLQKFITYLELSVVLVTGEKLRSTDFKLLHSSLDGTL